MVLSILLHANRARSVIPACVLVVGAVPHFTAALIYHGIAKLFRMPDHRVNHVQEAMFGYYQRFVLFFFENMSGVRVRLYGDVAACLPDEKVLYMCNHQTTVDWVVSDMLAWRIAKDMGRMRWMLKDTLQYMPSYGGYFYMQGCVYVRRGKGAFREDITRRELEYLDNIHSPYWLVVYPEGTRIDPSSSAQRSSSDTYSASLGRPPLEHVLCPRVTGMHLALQHCTSLDAIYDVTIAYSQSKDASNRHVSAANMFSYTSGAEGGVLHLHVRRTPIADVPTDKHELQLWLHARFEEKDAWLRQFYTPTFDDAHDEAFPDLVVSHSVTPLADTIVVAICYGLAIAPIFVSSTARRVYGSVWLGSSLLSLAYMKYVNAA